MYYGVKFGDLWREALKDDEGFYSPRMLRDEEERRFWKEHVKGRKGYEPDSYAEDVWNAVLEILKHRQVGKVLEIGPGWGNYTLKLAGMAHELSCVDISPDVLEYLNHILQSHGYGMHAYCRKWEDFRGNGYDLVFGFNCFYRMLHIEEALMNLHRTAAFRIIGMTSGPEQEYYPELERKLGVVIRYHKFDYIHLANVLYELGIDTNIRIVRLKRVYTYDTMSDAVKDVMAKIKPGYLSDGVLCEAVEEVVAPYFTRDASGKYRYTHHFHAGILYW